MNFRKALKSDTDIIRRYKKYSYNFPESYVEQYMNTVFSEDKCTVAEDNAVLTAYAEYSDYGIVSDNKVITARCINDVYTIPSKRRMGYMKGCINDILGETNRAGIPFCFCVPFDYKIFDSLGFRLVSDIKQYELSADDIPSYRMSEKINAVRELDENIINKISDVYDTYMKRKNTGRFYILRTAVCWRKIVHDFIGNYGGEFVVLYDEQMNLNGYILYTLEKNELCVFEYAYKTMPAYKSIMAFLKNHKYQAGRIIIKAAEDDMIFLDCANNNNITKILPFAMARITNVPEVLKQFETELSGININIFDPAITVNSGTWSVNAGAGVMPTSERADFETDIGTLTQMYLGYISASDALYMGYVKDISQSEDKRQRLENVFKKQNNYVNMLL